MALLQCWPCHNILDYTTGLWNCPEHLESLKLPGGAKWPPTVLTYFNPNAKTDVTFYSQLLKLTIQCDVGFDPAWFIITGWLIWDWLMNDWWKKNIDLLFIIDWFINDWLMIDYWLIDGWLKIHY